MKLLVEEHEKHPSNPYLFPSPRTGETWDPDGFLRLHDRIIKEIGAEHVRFHDMRHTFATLSLKSGVDVRTLSETPSETRSELENQSGGCNLQPPFKRSKYS